MNRPLSALEHLAWIVDQAVSQNFVIAASISCVASALTGPFLRKALDILQQKHPPLKCRIKDKEVPEYTSDDVPQIPLHIIERKGDEHWIEIAEKEMLEPLPWRTGPMLRVVLLNSKDKSDLLVGFCHIIADATSGINFVQNLLSIVDKLSKGVAIEPEPPLPTLPSTHDLIRDDLKYPPEFLDITGRIKRAIYKPVELKGDKEVLPEERITRVIQNTLSMDDTKKLVSKSRKEKTSVHAALCAALFQTMVVQIRQQQKVSKKGSLMIGCITPINVRQHFITPVGDNIGNFITDAFHYQLINDKSSLWAAARKVKKSIQKEIKFGRDIKAVRNIGELLEHVSTPVELLRTIDDYLLPVVVTNMGRLDVPEKFGDITLEELHFTVSVNPTAKSGISLAVTTFRGRMTINFLYAEPYISKERAVNMSESIVKRLKEAIRE